MRNKKERLTLKEDFFTHHKKKSIKRTKRKKRFDVWDGDDSGSNEMRRLNFSERMSILYWIISNSRVKFGERKIKPQNFCL